MPSDSWLKSSALDEAPTIPIVQMSYNFPISWIVIPFYSFIQRSVRFMKQCPRAKTRSYITNKWYYDLIDWRIGYFDQRKYTGRVALTPNSRWCGHTHVRVCIRSSIDQWPHLHVTPAEQKYCRMTLFSPLGTLVSTGSRRFNCIMRSQTMCSSVRSVIRLWSVKERCCSETPKIYICCFFCFFAQAGINLTLS